MVCPSIVLSLCALAPPACPLQPGCPCTPEVACFNRSSDLDPVFPSQGMRSIYLYECPNDIPAPECPLDCATHQAERASGGCCRAQQDCVCDRAIRCVHVGWADNAWACLVD